MSLRRVGTLVWLVLIMSACGGNDPTVPDSSALQRLGVAETDAQRYALDALATGQPYGLVAAAGRAFNALADGERAVVIEGLAGWARSYFDSDLFRSAYAERRSSSRPQPPSHSETVDEAVERWSREGLEQLAQSRQKVVPMLPEADRADLLESLDAMEAQYRDPDFVALHRQGVEMQRAADRTAVEAALMRWEEELPENHDDLIERHLQAFLATCADVDFDAELVERYGLLRFADPTYERKPWEWKVCFRAGQDSVEVAREAAKTWLSALR
jgi:hypothetical protein